MAYHVLKTVQPFYGAVQQGIKKFEVRINDRDFKDGDVLSLHEYDPQSDTFTGRRIIVTVTFILYKFPGLVDGWCIMGIKNN